MKKNLWKFLKDKTLRFPILKCLGALKKTKVCLVKFLFNFLLRLFPLIHNLYKLLNLFILYNVYKYKLLWDTYELIFIFNFKYLIALRTKYKEYLFKRIKGLLGLIIETTLTYKPTPDPILEFLDFIVNKKLGLIINQNFDFIWTGFFL